ncbi:hypothetical protein S245_066423, partial [Arachis hypogaea]
DLVAYRATGTGHMELLAEKAQPDASPNPSVPAAPNTVNVSEEFATPNTVPAPSIPLDNNAQPKSPTYTEPPSTSDDPQDEFLTQYVNVDDLNCVNPSEEPMAVRPPPSNSSTAYVPPRPIIKPTMSKRPIKRRNIKRPPPSQPSPLRPVPPQPTPITPTTPQPSVVRPTSPTNQPPPRVTRQTMHGASRGTTTRFMQFTPTPPSTIQTPGRWPVPGFRPPTGASSSGNNNGFLVAAATPHPTNMIFC